MSMPQAIKPTLTIDQVKQLPKRTWAHKRGKPKRDKVSRVPIMPSDAEQRFQRGATAAEIDAASTAPSGAWSAATLAGWGISWPPRAGWRAQLIANAKRNGHQ